MIINERNFFMLYTSLLVYKGKKVETYTISTYDSYSKKTFKCPIPREIYITLLTDHYYTIFKSTDEYVIYKLGRSVLIDNDLPT